MHDLVHALHYKHQVPCLCLEQWMPNIHLFHFRKGRKKVKFWSLTVAWEVFQQILQAPRKLEGKKKSFRGSQRLFAVTATEQCHIMPLFTTSARPGACQPVLHLPVSPHAYLSWQRNRDGSSSWCRSKSQKTDTEPSYANIVRKTVTLFPMVIELHTVILFREHLANSLLHFEEQLCKYSWNRLMGSVFCILENWSYR